eukprot:1379543-Rhodomonas_salina.1
MNIGPVGWRKSKPSVLQALEGTPALLALQDIRLPSNCVKAVRQSIARLAQQYQMFVTTHRQRERDEAGGRRRYWTGVMTLVHKELLPNLESVPLDRCGLTGEQQRACAGRVVVSCGQRQEVPNEAGQGVHSRMHYFVNVYQHTAAKRPQQRQLL